jgi:hypothetical protein
VNSDHRQKKSSRNLLTFSTRFPLLSEVVILDAFFSPSSDSLRFMIFMSIPKTKSNMKQITTTTLIALAIATPMATQAALYIDDFSTDTSANYIATDTYGSGGSFAISGGTLNISPAGGNTHNVFHKTAQLEAGEFVTTTISAGSSQSFLTISSTTLGPNTGSEDGIRWYLDNGTTLKSRTYRDGANTDVDYAYAGSGDLTLYIYRDDATTYRIGHDSGSGIVINDTITITETAADTGLFVGFEGYAGSTRNFQNLEIAAIPEPSTTALLGLGGLALILRRRK